MRYAARFPEHPPKLVLQSTRDELARTSYNLDLLSDPGSVIRHIDLRPELARVTCPTLVIAGDVDPWGSVDAAAEIVAALPDPLVRYEQFEGAGHHVHHDDPDRLFELLREFVAVPGQATAVPTRTHVGQPDRCSP